MSLVQPTPDEIKNGWTAESLSEFLEDQKNTEEGRYDEHLRGPRKADGTYRKTWPRQTHCNSAYNPLRR